MRNLLAIALLAISTSLFALTRDLDVPGTLLAEEAYFGIEIHHRDAHYKGSYPKVHEFKNAEFQEKIFAGLIMSNNIAFEITGDLHMNKSKPPKNHTTALTGAGFKVINITNTRYENLDFLSGIGFGHLKCRYYRDEGHHSRKRLIPRGIIGAQYMFSESFGIRGSILYDHSSMLKIHDMRIKNSLSFGLGFLSQL